MINSCNCMYLCCVTKQNVLSHLYTSIYIYIQSIYTQGNPRHRNRNSRGASNPGRGIRS